MLISGAVAMVLAAAFVGVWMWASFSVQSELKPIGHRYFTALTDGDGQTAYDMLCADAKARTSPEELSDEFPAARGADVRLSALRGTAPASLWPWSDSGVVGVGIESERVDVTRYIEMEREEDGWRVCPARKTPFQGREPH